MKKILLALMLLLSSFNATAEGNWFVVVGCATGDIQHNIQYQVDRGYSATSVTRTNGCIDIVIANKGEECDSGRSWDQSTQTCNNPPSCINDSSQEHCGAPSYTGDSVVNEDGSETDTINECYADGSCKHTSTTSSTTENPDGSSTYTESVTNSTSTSEGETSTETSSTVTHSDVTTSDSGTKLTETTTTTNSDGTATTTTSTTSTTRNDDGSTTQTVEVTSETGELISSSTTQENSDGSSASVDCSDVAYLNNPICRQDSVSDNNSTGCGDYGLSVVGENRCVSLCPDGYISFGNTCTKTNDTETAPDDTNQTSNDLLTRISKTLDQSKGIQEQIRSETKNVVKAVKDNTQSIVKAINEQGPNVGGGGGEFTVEIPEQTGGSSWSKTGVFQVFDHAGIDADIVQAKQDLKAVFSGIRSEMSSIFGDISVSSSSGCTTSFEILGTVYPFCVMDYQDQLSKIGLGLMALAYLLAFVIIVRR